VACNHLAALAALLAGGAACGVLATPPPAAESDSGCGRRAAAAPLVADTPLHTALRLGRLRAAAALLAAGASLAAEDAAGARTHTQIYIFPRHFALRDPDNTHFLRESLFSHFFPLLRAQAARRWTACRPPWPAASPLPHKSRPRAAVCPRCRGAAA
jgi:ankyrin repeat protein